MAIHELMQNSENDNGKTKLCFIQKSGWCTGLMASIGHKSVLYLCVVTINIMCKGRTLARMYYNIVVIDINVLYIQFLAYCTLDLRLIHLQQAMEFISLLSTISPHLESILYRPWTKFRHRIVALKILLRGTRLDSRNKPKNHSSQYWCTRH